VALITLNMAVFAPMPSAKVSTATPAKPRFFRNWRKANLRSFMTRCQLALRHEALSTSSKTSNG
jgi:hypothetical protein